MKTISCVFCAFFISGCASSADLFPRLGDRVGTMFSSGADDKVTVVYPAEPANEGQTLIEQHYGSGWRALSGKR